MLYGCGLFIPPRISKYQSIMESQEMLLAIKEAVLAGDTRLDSVK